MALKNFAFQVPYHDKFMTPQGLLSNSWQWFFRSIFERLYPLGIERQFTIVNNQAAAADVTEALFNKTGVGAAFFEFFIVREHSGGSKLVEVGLIIFNYRPNFDIWQQTDVQINAPLNSGVTFSITSGGQVQYTSTNVAGTPTISSLWWRARTFKAANTTYSIQGSR